MSDSPEIRFCVRCVISNQRPLACREFSRTADTKIGQMAFDAEGVCAACRVAERKASTDWAAREQALVEILARYRRTNRADVLVPGSGGKDSVYAAHLLKFRYGMHPLLVTWAPHEYTRVGLRNYRAWLAAGFDAMLVTPNPRVHAQLTRLAFTNLLHPFQPFILGQRALAPRLAAQFGIDLVVYGEDDSEYEGTAHTEQWGAEDFYTADPTKRLVLGGVPYSDLIGAHGLTPHDLAIYQPVAASPRTRVMALGYYIPWQPQAAYYFAAAQGFEANDERTEGTYSKYNSIDDRLDPLHYYTTWIKWGLGRASYDAAQEIRNGHLTREEGVALVHRYDGELRPETVAWACRYMGITREDFWWTITAARNARPGLWERLGSSCTLRHIVQ